MTNKANNISNCGGCLVMILVALALVLTMIDYCNGDEKARKRDEQALADFIAAKNLELDKKAASVFDKKEFRCYANKVVSVLDPAIKERMDAFKAGQIPMQQFKREAEIIYQEKSEQIFIECVKGETK